ncbi:MAG TPA: BlaI/MecI/CopY family transcriptional regulator [Thermoanaerobaculia bacterium]|nr:BlaI/MecI/CopY family transcriptional regulator [Thermoanaerobaculia bacterium]
MPKNATERLTPLELEIMNVLWETGPAAVSTVQERLSETRELAYTTVQTMLNILCKKGKLKRVLVDRAYHYRPAVTRRKAVGHAVRELVQRAFGGSAEALVMSLVESKQLSPEALKRLQKLVEDQHE